MQQPYALSVLDAGLLLLAQDRDRALAPVAVALFEGERSWPGSTRTAW